MKAPF
jgi:hypothetical protein